MIINKYCKYCHDFIPEKDFIEKKGCKKCVEERRKKLQEILDKEPKPVNEKEFWNINDTAIYC
jgi:reverse gyrase